MPKFCSNCGREINENNKFCDNCGTQAIPDILQPQNAQDNEKIYKDAMKGVRKHKAKTCFNSCIITLGVISLAIILLGFLIAYFTGAFTPSK